MTSLERDHELALHWRICQMAAEARRGNDPEAIADADNEFCPHERFSEWPLLRMAIRRERLRLVDATVGRTRVALT